MCEDAARIGARSRARSAPLEPLEPDEHRRPLPPLPERLWPALTPSRASSRRRRPRARGSGCSGSCRSLYDEMLPGITERQARVRRGGGRGAGRRSPTSTPAPPVKDREGIERAMRELEARDVDGLLVVMLTYGPAMRVARALARDAAAGLPGQHPARPGGHARVGHGRPDLQPGHPRRAGHRQRDGARRAARSRSSPTTGARTRSGTAIGRWARAAAAVTRWRALQGRGVRLRDERDGRHPRRRARAAARARPAGRRARPGRAAPRRRGRARGRRSTR